MSSTKANPVNWFKSGAYTLMHRVSNLLFGFGSFFILVRYLEKADFGAWALFISITAMVEIARNGLIQNAQIKFSVGADETEYPKILTASITLNTLITFISAGLLLGFGGMLGQLWSAEVLGSMFAIYALTTIILIPHSQFAFIMQANMDFAGIFWANLCRQGILFGFIITMVLTGNDFTILDLVWVMTAAALIAAFVGYFFVKPHLRLTKSLEWEWVKKLFRYGKFTFGTNISSMLFSSIDQMMLGYLMNTSAVALYNTSLRIVNFVEVPMSSVAAVVFPEAARLASQDTVESVRELFERSVGLILTMVVPVVIGTLLFTDWIILIIAGEDYLSAVPVLQVIIFFSLLQPFARQSGTTLDAINRPEINFRVLILTAGINVVTNYIFINMFGLMGAAYGTLTTMVIAFIVNYFILRRLIGASPMRTITYTFDFYKQGYHYLTQKVLKSGKE